MSFNYHFTTLYDASPTTTTLFTITAPAPTNYLIHVYGVSDDMTYTLDHTLDATYCLSWNGTIYNNMTLNGGSLQFEWSDIGNVISFDFTPVSGASSGSIGIKLTLVLSDSSIPPLLNL